MPSSPEHLLAGLRQSLSFSELLTHLRQCLGQLLHRCHVRSPRQVHTRTDRRHSVLNGAPLPCCNVWMTNAFLTHHEKSVHTRHHQVFLSLQGWTGQEMTHKQDVCKKSGSSLHNSQQVVNRGCEQCATSTVLVISVCTAKEHVCLIIFMRCTFVSDSHGCSGGY